MTQELIAELREWRVASAPYEPEYKVPPPKLHLKAADALECLTAERDALITDRSNLLKSRVLLLAERDALFNRATAAEFELIAGEKT